MKRINILDENTSNKIAAGEVVERPSSVVKELIENSIDAEAKNITVEIEEGGINLIKIIDDGIGIHEEDLSKAFMAHATSKIKNAEDIFAINSLGFRGEALPSIASISKVLMKSKFIEADSGNEIKIEGGEILEKNNVSCAQGTIIEVKDIFYNVPARKKFLKSTSRESALITDIVTRIAISHPDVCFKLYNNGKKIIHTYGTGKLEDVLRSIYGKNVCDDLIYFEEHNDIYSVYGYIGRETISRGSRNNESIFVNKRYVKDRKLAVAVENAFKAFATLNKYPFFVLFVDTYPELIDVNIHPTKAEVKFKDDRTAFKIIFDTVHKCFKEDLMGEFNLPEEIKKDQEEVEELSFIIKEEDINKEELRIKFNEKVSQFNHEASVNFDSTNEVKYEPTRVTDVINPGYTTTHTVSIDSNEKVDVPNYAKPISEDNYIIPSKNIETKTEYQETAAPVPIPKLPDLKVIGQFDKTYIIAEWEHNLFLIDQHAAHEKFMFEKYYNDILTGDMVVQTLLIPEVVELTLEDFSIYEENIDVFTKAGFTIEEFGDNTISIKEVPYFLGSLSSKRLLLEIMDNLRRLGSGKTVEVKYTKIATMACKAAVKAHDELNQTEMEALIEKLKYLDDPFHCPHGRPTIIKFTLTDIEKRFKRIV